MYFPKIILPQFFNVFGKRGHYVIRKFACCSPGFVTGSLVESHKNNTIVLTCTCYLIVFISTPLPGCSRAMEFSTILENMCVETPRWKWNWSFADILTNFTDESWAKATTSHSIVVVQHGCSVQEWIVDIACNFLFSVSWL